MEKDIDHSELTEDEGAYNNYRSDKQYRGNEYVLRGAKTFAGAVRGARQQSTQQLSMPRPSYEELMLQNRISQQTKQP